MRLRNLTAAAAVAVAIAFAAPAATAQATCEETQFGSKTGQLYLDAETALITNSNPQGALAKINQLKGMALNCYERSVVIRLSAAANVQAGNYSAAVVDLEEAINTGGLQGEDKVKTYYQIAQIYLQEDNIPKATSFLEKWLAAGGKPNKQQNMQLATLYSKLGNNTKAIKYLEDMLNMDPNPDKQSIDFAVYLYNTTGQKAKLATFLSQKVIPRFPEVKNYWEVMASLYYEANNERKAFEVTKAMYLAGFLTSESEVMRIVNFYNTFNSPYEAAKVLEKEMNAGRIKATPEKLETLANLYQVAREYDRAIPVIQKFAQQTNSGAAYERLGRSYFELKKYDEAEKNLRIAFDKGGMKDKGFAWVIIGQMQHEKGNRKAARDAFKTAANLGDRGGRGWLSFMDAEDETKEALRTFDTRVKLDEERNLKKICAQAAVLGGDPPESCVGVEERIVALEVKLGERTPEGEEAPAEGEEAKEE